MGYYHILIPRESVWEIVNMLGRLGNVQFEDMNRQLVQVYERPYYSQIKKCEETEQQINQIEIELMKFDKKIQKCQNPQKLLNEINKYIQSRNKSSYTFLDEIRIEIQDISQQINSQLKSYDQLLQQKLELTEYLHVLIHGSNYLKHKFSQLEIHDNLEAGGVFSNYNNIDYVAGVVDKDLTQRFYRMIFRVSRDNALTMISSIECMKSAFVIIFPYGANFKRKIERICESFKTHKYDDQQCSYIEETKIFIRKEKLLYSTLGKFILRDSIMHGQFWSPKQQEQELQQALDQLKKEHPEIIVSFQYDGQRLDLKPPTYIKTNEFTAPFQLIVNTYGSPRYQEINPGLFTIVTFPFLFGVMFGDIGHGLLLFIFSLCLYKYSEAFKKQGLSSLVQARSLLLLMGFFALYSGIIYNDFMALPINLLGSCYSPNANTKRDSKLILMNQTKGCVYPIGIDPVWYHSKAELTFLNSLKMKLSIILGIAHMTFGLILKGINALNFRDIPDFLFGFIPQLLFMSSTFGYMVVTIFIKWSVNWRFDQAYAQYNPPSIIQLFINFFLKNGSASDTVLWGNSAEQTHIQSRLFYTCLICIPIMLIPKPLYTWFTLKKREKEKLLFNLKLNAVITNSSLNNSLNPLITNSQGNFRGYVQNIQQDQIDQATTSKQEQHNNESLDEVVIHNFIETIEFVLGCVSNTASYLRLWALSLAHAQLAKIFYEKTIGMGIEHSSFILLILLFPIFAVFTVSVIMCMDIMECFLHALRLHWVEFQSKFYKADGNKFSPLIFGENLLSDSDDINKN